MWIRPELDLEIPIDTVVFDIDGVIWDAQDCYNRCTVEVVDWLLRNHFGIVEPQPVTLDEIRLLKQAGGFNVDYDVAWTFVALRLAALDGRWHGSIPHIASLASESDGRGLAWAQQYLPEGWTLDYGLVRRLCDEFYYGDQLQPIFGVEPKHGPRPGYMRYERPLLTQDIMQHLQELGIKAFGVATSRVAAEAAYPLDVLGLTSLVPPAAVVTRDHIHKPDPAVLAHIAAVLDTRCGLYCGDNRDDLNLVLNYRLLPAQARFLSVMVEADRQDNGDLLSSPYGSLGADVLIQHIGELPQVVEILNRKVNA